MHKELTWLKNNYKLLNIRAIEKKIGIPEGHISKWCRGIKGRDLPLSWHKPVAEWVKKFKQS